MFSGHSGLNWRPYVESLGMTVGDVSWADWAAHAYALPDPIEPTSWFLRAEVHPVRKNAGLTHWILTFEPVKSPVPPEAIERSSKRVGGLEQFVSSLVEAWPTTREVRAELKVRYLADADAWRSPLFLSAKPIDQERAGLRTRLASQLLTWSVQGPAGESEVSVFCGLESTLRPTAVEWTQELSLSTSLLADLEEQGWHRISKLFSKKTRRRSGTEPT